MILPNICELTLSIEQFQDFSVASREALGQSFRKEIPIQPTNQIPVFTVKYKYLTQGLLNHVL